MVHSGVNILYLVLFIYCVIYLFLFAKLVQPEENEMTLRLNKTCGMALV